MRMQPTKEGYNGWSWWFSFGLYFQSLLEVTDLSRGMCVCVKRLNRCKTCTDRTFFFFFWFYNGHQTLLHGMLQGSGAGHLPSFRSLNRPLRQACRCSWRTCWNTSMRCCSRCPGCILVDATSTGGESWRSTWNILKLTIYSGFSHKKWWFYIAAMLNYQRVTS